MKKYRMSMKTLKWSAYTALRCTMLASCLFLLLLALWAVPGALADSFKVKDCDADAAADITEAYRFVANNLNAIFDPMTFLTSKQRAEMKDKWRKLTVDCIDNKTKCVNTSNVLGRAHGGLGNQVNICYYNHVDLGDTLCELVATLVHEEGHANGLPSMKGHNNPTATVFNNDLIFIAWTVSLKPFAKRKRKPDDLPMRRCGVSQSARSARAAPRTINASLGSVRRMNVFVRRIVTVKSRQSARSL